MRARCASSSYSSSSRSPSVFRRADRCTRCRFVEMSIFSHDGRPSGKSVLRMAVACPASCRALASKRSWTPRSTTGEGVRDGPQLDLRLEVALKSRDHVLCPSRGSAGARRFSRRGSCRTRKGVYCGLHVIRFACTSPHEMILTLHDTDVCRYERWEREKGRQGVQDRIIQERRRRTFKYSDNAHRNRNRNCESS